jgi:iron complex outermembrane receptor protein
MVLRILILSALVALSGMHPSLAQATIKLQIEIPAQALSSALATLAKQTRTQFIYPSEFVEGRISLALSGSMTREEALDRLLAHTNLKYKFLDDSTVTLFPSKGTTDPRGGAIHLGLAQDGGVAVASASQGDSVSNIPPAQAAATGQEATPSAPPASSDTSQPTTQRNLDEIVVTAQRRSERAIDVPMSITATSGAELERTGVSSTGDLSQVTPGLVTPSVGLAFTPAIRGVTSVSTSPGDETNVALYLDDVYIGAPIAGLFEFRDLDRIEVLKGPQGTLFGRNATGGAIRLVTLTPSFTPEANVSVDYGVEFDRVKTSAYATGGLSDKVAVSGAVYYVDDHGYIEGIGPDAGQNFGKDYDLGGRVKSLIKPTDDLAITLSADTTAHHDSIIYAWVPRASNFLYKNTPGAVIGGDYQYSGSTDPLAQLNGWGTSASADWTPPGGTEIRSITAVRDVQGLYRTDTDRINLDIGGLQLRQDQLNVSQELIFSTAADRLFSFVGGLYYYHARAWNPYFDTYAGNAPTGTVTTSFTNNVHTNSYAGYGELTFNPTSRLHLTAGGRYTSEKKDIDFRFLVRAAGLASQEEEHTWVSPTYRAVARFDLTDNSNVYFSASDGFKSGVFNAYAYPVVAVQPEKINAYEVGFKGEFAGLTATLAGFAYNYSDIQVQGQSQIGGVFVVTLTNAAAARIRGLEADLQGHIVEHLKFDIGASALPTAEYSNYRTAQVFVPQALGNLDVVPYDATGSRTIRSPKFQGDARLDYTNDLLGGVLDASLSYSYNSGYYFQPGDFSFQGAYSVLNGRLAWTDPAGRFTYAITAENLTDARYSFYTTDSLAGTADVLARPRVISLGVAAKF